MPKCAPNMSRKDFLSLVAGCAAAAAIPASHIKNDESVVSLGKALFDVSFRWDERDGPDGETAAAIRSLGQLTHGDRLLLTPFAWKGAQRNPRKDSVWSCCSVENSKGDIWRGVLDDKPGLDVAALKILEKGAPVYGILTRITSENIDGFWPESITLYTLSLDIEVVLG